MVSGTSLKENREDLLRYIEALFYLIYKPKRKHCWSSIGIVSP